MMRWSAAFGGLLLFSCATTEAGWTRVDLVPFTMVMPDDLKEVPVKPIDSYVRHFECPTMTLGFDWGQWSDPLTSSDGPEISREAVMVGGRNAVVVVSRSKESPSRIEAAIHFPNPSNSPKPESDDAKLTIYMELNSESSIPIARKIFNSVRFKKD
jgi:hypothetical protein